MHIMNAWIHEMDRLMEKVRLDLTFLGPAPASSTSRRPQPAIKTSQVVSAKEIRLATPSLQGSGEVTSLQDKCFGMSNNASESFYSTVV